MTSPACDQDRALDLVAAAAALLFANGQTTERVVQAAEQLGHALGYGVAVFPRWGELAVRVQTGSTLVFVTPLGIDMGKVAAATDLIEQLSAGTVPAADALAKLETIARSPSVSTFRFTAMAGAGAVALGVIFGAAHLLSLVLIGVSAGLGGLLRRGVALMSRNPFIQPLSAALLAGLVGAVAVRFQLSTAQRLIAVCPCMVLVPGPHLLNGAIDLARARILLGAARLIYAGLIVAAVCAGLLGGLALGGVTLPADSDAQAAPFAADVIAAGVAVAAYGSFFSMPWRMLPVPVLIGMLAHAVRWILSKSLGATPEVGALGACLLAGALASPASDRLRQPFAGLAFASVVSLIPGVYLFRMAGGLVALASGATAQADLVPAVIADGSTALLTLLAMTFGVMLPRLVAEGLEERARNRAATPGTPTP